MYAYTRINGKYTARAFGEVVTAHSKPDLDRQIMLAERRAKQRAAIRNNQRRTQWTR